MTSWQQDMILICPTGMTFIFLTGTKLPVLWWETTASPSTTTIAAAYIPKGGKYGLVIFIHKINSKSIVGMLWISLQSISWEGGTSEAAGCMGGWMGGWHIYKSFSLTMYCTICTRGDQWLPTLYSVTRHLPWWLAGGRMKSLPACNYSWLIS